MSRSLRSVLLVPVLVTSAAGFLAFALYVDHGESARRISEIDGELSRAARVVLEPGTGATPVGSGVAKGDAPVHLRLSADGRIAGGRGADNPFSPDSLVELAAVDQPGTVDVQDLRVQIAPQTDGQTLITALPLTGYHTAMDALRRSLVAGGLVLVVLEGVILWLLAGRLVRPLTEMATTATRIADGALDTGIRPGGGSREVEQLSIDVGRMVARLRTALDEQEMSAAEATRARDDMRRFLADVSHEIRTPLTALRGYSDLYARGMLAEPGAVDRAMARVGSESMRLHGLVSSMMELARGDETSAQVVVDVDVTDVARAVVDDVRAAWPGRRIDLAVGDPGPVVPGDPARLHQALLNLGANACAHTEVDPVTVEPVPGAVTVHVVDHGAGIDEAERERIFLPFYRSDPSRVRDGHGGAGLGLAVTRRIAHDHDGTVTAHPTPGGGATLTLRLPRTHLDVVPDHPGG